MRKVYAILLCVAMLSSAVLSAVPAPPPVPTGASVGGETAPDGTPMQVPVPAAWHLRNNAGTDGAGNCVFTSIDHAARMQGVAALVGFRDWMARHPGGGYPQKVDRMIEMICRERGVEKPKYLHVEGLDMGMLRLACATRRVPGVTYGVSPTGRYGGQPIAHMVSLVHADDKHFAVLDNNHPGSTQYEWLTPEEFRHSWTLRSAPPGHPRPSPQGWAVILLSPGPCPMPIN